MEENQKVLINGPANVNGTLEIIDNSTLQVSELFFGAGDTLVLRDGGDLTVRDVHMAAGSRIVFTSESNTAGQITRLELTFVTDTSISIREGSNASFITKIDGTKINFSEGIPNAIVVVAANATGIATVDVLTTVPGSGR